MSSCVAIACAHEAVPCDAGCEEQARPLAWSSYQGPDARLGWNRDETSLTPAAIAADGLAIRWQSPVLDVATIDGIDYPPHIYASPLLTDELAHDGGTIRAVLTATSNGYAYAIAAEERACRRCGPEPGAIIWSRRLVEPTALERLDGGMPMGVLSTPIHDPERARLYVVALDRRLGWSAFALDVRDGRILDDWPVSITDVDAAPLNTNAPAKLQRPEMIAQRGALQLSPQGDRLYVAFGTFRGEGAGWIVAIDTETPQLASAFASARSSELVSNGGIWGAGGPAIDENGDVWVTTGNSPEDSLQAPGTWGNSLLRLDRDLQLRGAYTPFNYCWLDFADMDLAASPPLLVPALPDTSTPNVVAFGSKQGNVYLLDRDTLQPAGDARPPCSSDASTDRSLLPPEPQPQFGTRGPLNVFGPYTELYGALDFAKMRSRVAYAELGGERRLYVAGSTKAAEDSEQGVPPSLARLQIVTPPGEPAHLAIAQYNDVALVNPGSPIVSSDGDRDAVVWVVDENAPRVASLLDPATPGPVLYPFDAESLALLWRSEEGALARGGKYGTPVVAHGTAIVATDRITAFGLPLATDRIDR